MQLNDYQLPSIRMLSVGDVSSKDDGAEIFANRDIIMQTIRDFGFTGKVTGYKFGPRVTRYEIAIPDADHIWMIPERIEERLTGVFCGRGVRVVRLDPEHAVIGVEIANTKGEAVFLRSVVESEAWRNMVAEIPIALGRDVAGQSVVIDLDTAPHILISGSTGSGKSVCINSFILSLLLKFEPDELKFILIDPKIVELEEYRELPHLLTPVINDCRKAIGALRWTVGEIESRLRLMECANMNDIGEYNRCSARDDKLPGIIVVVDELADFMVNDASMKSSVEESIAYIAQKGRPTGVHIVVVTSRPNIITDIIRIHFPTRLCFQMRSREDSCKVLDVPGAEKLLGMGDMFMKSPGNATIKRIQGAFAPDDDICHIVRFVCRQAKPKFDHDLVEAIRNFNFSPKRRENTMSDNYEFPNVNLLSVPPIEEPESTSEIFRKRDVIMQTLREFDIAGEVTDYTVGPRVTHFEITILPSVEPKEIENIADNIAMNLGVSSIRFVPFDHRRHTVGLEVENTRSRREIFAQPMLMSKKWDEFPSALPLLIGKTWNDAPVIDSLTTAPHILISGATGSGKSVFMHTIITGLLFKYRPEALKFILIDFKVVEFGIYENLPHLLAPIIHDETKAAGALRWMVGEIDRRFSLMREAEVRNIREYNNCRREEEKIPYIVVIVDDLADLMTTDAREDVENSIVRIAQRGRTAGIHIIVATQRPSSSIITDTIKAYLPTRFCFQVRSCVDSRVVLDTVGAEKLLGWGDMLMKTPVSDSLDRVQGAFIPWDDMRRIAEFVSRQSKPEFSPELINEQVNYFYFSDEGKNLPQEVRFFAAASKFIRDGDDDLTREAVMLIIRERKASTSYLQRRLKIGYNRAVEILDELEARKLVSSKSREDGKREILANFSQE